MPSLSIRETALEALASVIGVGLPGATVERNAVVPQTVPSGGLIIVRDGDPGEPGVTLSPPRYEYAHQAVVEVITQPPGMDARAVLLDQSLIALGQALAGTLRLGGAVDYLSWSAPVTDDVAVPYGDAIRGAIVRVTLHYTTSNPLL
ncbi:Acyl-CoA transferase [uncultured Gammaproteobacteria bacterium]